MLDFSLSDEQKALIETARRFSRERIIPVAAECDRDARFPKDVFDAAHELGLVNATVEPEYGGAGLGELDNALIAEELAYGCTGIQTSMLANTLALTPIKLGGNEEQKKKYLGMLTAEPLFASYCTTEPSGGSDVAGMQTTLQEGRRRLRAERRKVLDHEREPRELLRRLRDERPEPSATRASRAFIVDRDTPGLRVGKHEDKLGQRASDTAAVHFEDVKVPKANLLAPEGDGFKLAMETFNQTRPDIGAMATGLMQRCLDECVAYAKERKTFGVADRRAPARPGDARRDGDPHRRRRGCSTRRPRGTSTTASAIPSSRAYAKAYGADRAMQTAIDAVQVFGGNGYVKEYPVEKLMRDAKVLQIYEGTSQIQRLVIARSLIK